MHALLKPRAAVAALADRRPVEGEDQSSTPFHHFGGAGGHVAGQGEFVGLCCEVSFADSGYQACAGTGF